MWRGCERVRPLGLVLVLCCRLSQGDLPSCTFESCPVCLEGAKPTAQNITVEGLDGVQRSSTFRIAGIGVSWDSQAMVGQVLGIILRDKFGLEVEQVHCEDEVQCLLAVSGCAGWHAGTCEPVQTQEDAVRLAAAGSKQFADALPDVLAAMEVQSNAMEAAQYDGTGFNVKDRQSVEVGGTGFTLQDGLYLYRSKVEAAWQGSGHTLSSYMTLTTPAYRAYLDPPAVLMADGVVAEHQDCASSNEIVQSGMDKLTAMGWTCNSSWWLTPACQALGAAWQDECFAVVDDDWSCTKDGLYRAMADSGIRAAKLTLGYEGILSTITSQNYSVGFCWWNTDTQFLSLRPVRVNFDQEMEAGQAIVSKSIYKPLQVNVPLYNLLSSVIVTNKDLDGVLRAVSASNASRGQTPAEESRYFQKLACDWVRSTEVWRSWLPNPQSCSVGQYFDEKELQCAPCPAGRSAQRRKGTAGAQCDPCLPGRFAANGGQSACGLCAPGLFANASGSSSCLPCPIAHYASEAGASSCRSCAANRTNAELWTTMKRIASESGQLRWSLSDGMASPSDCGCDRGAWQTGDACVPCSVGMRCEGMGQGTPQLLPGYYSYAKDPFSVFQCVDADACPGGAPETCLADRLGLVCAICPEGRTRGGCAPCASWPWVVVVGSPIILCLVILITYRSANAPVTVDANISLTVSVWVGLVITCCQVLGIFNRLAVRWPSQASAPMAYFSGILVVDFRALAVECVLGQRPASLYLAQVLIPLAIVPMATGLYFLSQLLGGRKDSRCCVRVFGAASSRPWALERNRLVNTVGHLLQILFIPFVVIAVRAFECDDHPNGKQSVHLFPEVLCYTSDHTPLLLFSGLLVLFFIIPFLALSVWAVIVAPSKKGPSGHRFFLCWRFLLYRFRADVWWWGVVFIARQLCLAFSTVVPANDPQSQLLFTSVALAVYSGSCLRAWPWKNVELNIFDATSSFTLFLVLVAAFAFVPGSEVKTSHIIALAVMLCLLVFIVGLMAFFLARHFWRHGLRGEFSVLKRWEPAVWKRMDRDLFADAVGMMSRFDRSQLQEVCNIWQSMFPEAVSEDLQFQSGLSSRCNGWVHSGTRGSQSRNVHTYVMSIASDEQEEANATPDQHIIRV